MTSVSGKREKNHIHEIMPGVRFSHSLGLWFLILLSWLKPQTEDRGFLWGFWKSFRGSSNFLWNGARMHVCNAIFQVSAPVLHFYGQITITEVKVWCDLWFPLGLLTGTKISIDARLLFVRAARNVAGRSQCWPSSCQFPLSGAPSSLASSLSLSCNLSLSIYMYVFTSSLFSMIYVFVDWLM